MQLRGVLGLVVDVRGPEGGGVVGQVDADRGRPRGGARGAVRGARPGARAAARAVAAAACGDERHCGDDGRGDGQRGHASAKSHSGLLLRVSGPRRPEYACQENRSDVSVRQSVLKEPLQVKPN